MMTCLLTAFALAVLIGLALSRASAKHRTSEEDRLDHAENETASELRSYHGGGWMDRHREIADEMRFGSVAAIKGCDDIDRIYIESEGME